MFNQIDKALPFRSSVNASDLVRSYVGLLVKDKSDFDAIESFRADRVHPRSRCVSDERLLFCEGNLAQPTKPCELAVWSIAGTWLSVALPAMPASRRANFGGWVTAEGPLLNFSVRFGHVRAPRMC